MAPHEPTSSTPDDDWVKIDEVRVDHSGDRHEALITARVWLELGDARDGWYTVIYATDMCCYVIDRGAEDIPSRYVWLVVADTGTPDYERDTFDLDEDIIHCAFEARLEVVEKAAPIILA